MMVSIDRAGRIVIPKRVRDRLSLEPGTELNLELHGDSIVIERPRKPARRPEWTDDGRPFFAAEGGQHLTDLDVQRLRDAQRSG